MCTYELELEFSNIGKLRDAMLNKAIRMYFLKLDLYLYSSYILHPAQSKTFQRDLVFLRSLFIYFFVSQVVVNQKFTTTTDGWMDDPGRKIPECGKCYCRIRDDLFVR